MIQSVKILTSSSIPKFPKSNQIPVDRLLFSSSGFLINTRTLPTYSLLFLTPSIPGPRSDLESIASGLKELNQYVTLEMSSLRDSMHGMGDRLEKKMDETHGKLDVMNNKLDEGFRNLEILLKS